MMPYVEGLRIWQKECNAARKTLTEEQIGAKAREAYTYMAQARATGIISSIPAFCKYAAMMGRGSVKIMQLEHRTIGTIHRDLVTGFTEPAEKADLLLSATLVYEEIEKIGLKPIIKRDVEPIVVIQYSLWASWMEDDNE